MGSSFSLIHTGDKQPQQLSVKFQKELSCIEIELNRGLGVRTDAPEK